MNGENVVSLVDRALDQATLRFSVANNENPPLFDSAEAKLTDSVGINFDRDVRILGVTIVVPNVVELKWEPAPGDPRQLPYFLERGILFRLNGLRSAIAAQMPQLLEQKKKLQEAGGGKA